MRNLKKLLAVIVSVCVLATFALPAFAAETTTLTDAQISEKLGAVKGDTSQGVTDEYLAKGTTRLQAAIIYLRMLNLEEEALAFESEDNFADAADVPWAGGRAILAYLKANPELGWQGVSETTFEPNGAASAQMMYKVALEALGYKQGTDFEWADVFTFAADKGLGKAADLAELTNNDMCTIVVEMLGIKVKDGDVTLIEKLVADGVIAEADAIEVGLIAAEPEELEVVDVTADNLVRVIVTFNKAIDKDSIGDGDFEVDGSDVDADNVSLSDDKKVATLKLNSDDSMSNGDEIEISISGIKAVDGAELEDYESEFTPQDTEAPKVESIEFTGPETVKVTFSEPIDEDETEDPEVVIDGGVYSGSPAEGFNNSDSVTIDLGTELDEGKHTFKIKGFEDFAGYSNIVKTVSVEYAEVDEAPSVEVKKATQSYVILKFERPVKDVEVDDFYQTYSTWKPLEVQNEDGDELLDENEYYDVVRLAFTNAEKVEPDEGSGADDDDKPLPVGKTKIVVKDESVEDRWGNEIDGDITLTAEVTADTEKPEVTKVTVESEKEIRVYFDEDVDAADAADDDNYTIKDSKGKVISASRWDVTYNKSDKYAKILFTKALDKGDYKITIEAIADASISGNLLDTVTFDFEVTDKSASLDGVEVTWIEEDSVLYIKYGDEMDASSVLDEDNYRLNNKKFDNLFDEDGDVKLTMFTSKIVKVQFRALTEEQKDLIAGYQLQIGRVKDAAGNIVSEFSKTVAVEAEDAPEITKIKKIAENKFEFKVDQELKSISSGAIKVDADGTESDDLTAKNASYKFVNDGKDTIITVTVPSDHKSLGTEKVTDTYTFIIAAETIKSVTGKYMESATIVAGGALGEFEDAVPPAFAKDGEGDKIIYAYESRVDDDTVEVDGEDETATLVDHFIVKYTEDIKAGSVSKYTFEVDGYKVTSVTVVDADNMGEVRDIIDTAVEAGTAIDGDPAGKYLVIAVDELDDGTLDDTDQTPRVTQRLSIEDVAGNVLEAQDPVKAIAEINAYDSGDVDRD